MPVKISIKNKPTKKEKNKKKKKSKKSKKANKKKIKPEDEPIPDTYISPDGEIIVDKNPLVDSDGNLLITSKIDGETYVVPLDLNTVVDDARDFVAIIATIASLIGLGTVGSVGFASKVAYNKYQYYKKRGDRGDGVIDRLKKIWEGISHPSRDDILETNRARSEKNIPIIVNDNSIVDSDVIEDNSLSTVDFSLSGTEKSEGPLPSVRDIDDFFGETEAIDELGELPDSFYSPSTKKKKRKKANQSTEGKSDEEFIEEVKVIENAYFGQSITNLNEGSIKYLSEKLNLTEEEVIQLNAEQSAIGVNILLTPLPQLREIINSAKKKEIDKPEIETLTPLPPQVDPNLLEVEIAALTPLPPEVNPNLLEVEGFEDVPDLEEIYSPVTPIVEKITNLKERDIDLFSQSLNLNRNEVLKLEREFLLENKYISVVPIPEIRDFINKKRQRLLNAPRLLEEENKKRLQDEERKQRLLDEVRQKKLLEEQRQQKLLEELRQEMLVDEANKQRLLEEQRVLNEKRLQDEAFIGPLLLEDVPRRQIVGPIKNVIYYPDFFDSIKKNLF